jgi:hypothetical protein
MAHKLLNSPQNWMQLGSTEKEAVGQPALQLLHASL